jgi:NADH:ubiquinone oxidoreductase subunit F (NADH-binding)/(2Fe-2S) ferredoxin
MMITSKEQLLAYRSEQDPVVRPANGSNRIDVLVGMGTCDIAAGAKETLAKLRDLVHERRLDHIVVSSVGCIGYCSEEPTVEVRIPDREPLVFRRITEDRVEALLEDILVEQHLPRADELIPSFHQSGIHLENQKTLIVCAGQNAPIGNDVIALLKNEVATQGLSDTVRIIAAGCGEFHDQSTAVKVQPDNILYDKVTPADVDDIVRLHLKHGVVVDRLIAEDTHDALDDVHIDFYKKQYRIALRNCGYIDPENIDQYIAARGYEALAECLTNKQPKDVIDIVKASQLRGRGGGGFSTGLKWDLTARETSDEKYVICNADEGDPGAFMDRSILEGDPHSVIEAMAIAGYATGSNHGIVYIRAEYPLAIERLVVAIGQARSYGFLGKNLFQSGFDFDIELRLGAGAFVCGEETALIHSIEGCRGEPTKKPPFPSVSGFRQKPTTVNNVETFANIAPIILNGPEWFSSIGTETSKGTKVFALAGKVNNIGLIEVPMGTTLREIIFEIGGGIVHNRAFKALQTGGPSGGVVTAEHLDTPIDYESLRAIGSMMGSGGMIVLDEEDDMVQLAKFYLDFTQDESCGKCTPCRIGTKRLYEILERLTNMQGSQYDLELLEDLSVNIKNSALCGLGQSAPNPVLSTLHYFRDEYNAYADRTKRTAYRILEDECIGCTKCARVCPVDCIEGTVKLPHIIDEDTCIACGACYDACPVHAIERP